VRSWERWYHLADAPKTAWDLAVRGRHGFVFDYMPMTVRGMGRRQRLNTLRAGLNLVHRRLSPWAWPLNMQFELASCCNLRCPVCPVGTGELTRPAQFMDVALFERAMEEVGHYLLMAALWAWGEPLLHPALERVLAIAARYPVATLLSTNGQNLDRPDVLHALQQHPPTYLIVALDGLTDETNAVYRQGARLAPALAGVRALAEWKRQARSRLPILHMRLLAMRHNEHEVPHLRQFAVDHDFDMVSLRSLSIIDSPDQHEHGELLPRSARLQPYAVSGGRRARRTTFVCQHAFTFPTLLADGTVVSCEQDYNAIRPYGVMAGGTTFSEIWFGERARAVRQCIRDTPAELSFCRNCPFADRATSSCSLEGYLLRPADRRVEAARCEDGGRELSFGTKGQP
jgi:MoaA/NifB/PqqE/SkfB family radical SAM enzyme